MIGPDRYESALAGRGGAIRVADPPIIGIQGMMPDAGDRLEAALDAALAESAGDRRILMRGEIRVVVPLADIRAWLGYSGHRGAYGEWKWEWTKQDVEMLFTCRGGVRDRYVAGGWGRCGCGWGSRQARGIVFTFLTDSGVRRRKEKMGGDDADAALQVRAARAMIELGDALGVKRGGRMQMHISGVPEDAVGHLEDLRLAAKLMRFDLEAWRREGRPSGGPDADGGDDGGPDGYYPPFEGSPDDGSFGE